MFSFNISSYRCPTYSNAISKPNAKRGFYVFNVTPFNRLIKFNHLIFYTFVPFKNRHGVFENQYKPGTIAQTYCHHHGWEWADGPRCRARTGYLVIIMEWKASGMVVEACAELGMGYLTLYAFSTENWERPVQEVSGLMELLVDTIRKEVPTLNKNNIRLHVIGNTQPAAGKNNDSAQ